MIAGGANHYQVAEQLQQILNKSARIMPRFDYPIDNLKHAGTVTGSDSRHDVVQKRIRGVTQQGGGQVVVDSAFSGAGHELIHDRQGVADRATARADDQRKDAAADLDVFFLAQVLEVVN